MINRPRDSLTILSNVDPDRGLLLIAPFYWEKIRRHCTVSESGAQSWKVRAGPCDVSPTVFGLT